MPENTGFDQVDEFWHFGHSVLYHPRGNIYTGTLTTFEARPPFRPLRMVPYPILMDSSRQRPRAENPAKYLVGAVRRGDRWLLSYGLHNTFSEIATFDHAALESALRPVVPATAVLFASLR